MILFEKIKYKNFLSTGDNFTEIDFVKANSTLIVGDNGSGKSTMLDALSFALFGKPHRNINKPQLVNSINKKNCVVELRFSIAKSKFHIIRGIKPNIFQIFKNGNIINESSHSKDYQKILEKNIIKMNHKSFHQIVVLGSTSFTPFMELPAAHRREVIEDLLDINVFSKMNVILKEKQSSIKDKMKELDYKINIAQNSIDVQNKYIRDITAMNEEEIADKKEQIDTWAKTIFELQEKIDNSTNTIAGTKDVVDKHLKEANDRQQAFSHRKMELNTKIQGLVKEASFYETNTSCPTCHQDIDEAFVTSKLSNIKHHAKEIKLSSEKIDENSEKIQEVIKKFSSKLDTIQELQNQINLNNKEIAHINSNIDDNQKSILRLTDKKGDISQATDELDNLTVEKNGFRQDKMESNEVYTYNVVMGEMLKDSGIKTKILKQYIPIINKLVNQYLQILDFFVSFNLDENFNEVIRSRHRDHFSYASFSEGEKQRIDLALLFTWRQIAKMKNSISTNLLILDETFDSSLDFDGVENLIKILKTLDDNTNVFVISHKGEILENRFDRKIEYVKKQNFSYIKEQISNGR